LGTVLKTSDPPIVQTALFAVIPDAELLSIHTPKVLEEFTYLHLFEKSIRRFIKSFSPKLDFSLMFAIELLPWSWKDFTGVCHPDLSGRE
jgi:hypothetical protein